MNSFDQLSLIKPLRTSINDLNFTEPTQIQLASFSVIRSGTDIVGIAQTGTGKTIAYLLPILQDLKYSKSNSPRVMILVPTRELVLQVVEQVNLLSKYMNIRVLGLYGGTNINTQKDGCSNGLDLIVATPGRLYDLAACRAIQLKSIKQLVIDEVDVMMDLGFNTQLANIFSLLSERRQNIMFSATMTEEVDNLIDGYFIKPKKISIALSGTPLFNISQTCFPVPNFYTKLNLLKDLLSDHETFVKTLIFVSNKKHADIVFDFLEESFENELCVIHSNKTQNYRVRSIQQFDQGIKRILISTDVMARGLDLNKISHIINFNTPLYPENYIHRIGRTGRAKEKGHSILLFTPKEVLAKSAIESLMNFQIPEILFPTNIEVSQKLLPEERDWPKISTNRSTKIREKKDGYHQKKEKNNKMNTGGSYRAKLAKKYKKSQTKGDIVANRRSKNYRK
jgi:ATP-dependent RNA helicase RhlE